MQAFQILLVLIVIIAVFATLAPISFANIGNARLIAQNASILAVLGVGMTFVIVTSGIDLSIGSVMVFSGVVAAKVMQAVRRRRLGHRVPRHRGLGADRAGLGPAQRDR